MPNIKWRCRLSRNDIWYSTFKPQTSLLQEQQLERSSQNLSTQRNNTDWHMNERISRTWSVNVSQLLEWRLESTSLMSRTHHRKMKTSLNCYIISNFQIFNKVLAMFCVLRQNNSFTSVFWPLLSDNGGNQ